MKFLLHYNIEIVINGGGGLTFVTGGGKFDGDGLYWRDFSRWGNEQIFDS